MKTLKIILIIIVVLAVLAYFGLALLTGIQGGHV